MTTCDVCGNDYEQAFEVTVASGERFVFDSIECAAQRLAPTCANCGCRVLGHGVQNGDSVFCCAHCARMAGVPHVVDQVADGT